MPESSDNQTQHQAELVHTLLAQHPQARLHLGCGEDYREGYINIDVDQNIKADLYLDVTDLSCFPDASVHGAECYHLFEHLDFADAGRALKEWFRVLVPGGKLILEMPNLDRCIRELGKHYDDRGFDLAMVGIYGYPPLIDRVRDVFNHRWGWTPETLTAELESVGFVEVQLGAVTQTWRQAVLFDRDMHIEARRPLGMSSSATQTRPQQPPPATQEAKDIPIQDYEIYELRKQIVALSRANLEHERRLRAQQERNAACNERIQLLDQRIQHLNENIRKLKDSQKRKDNALKNRDRIIQEMRASTAWKLGIAITRPTRQVLSWIRGR